MIALSALAAPAVLALCQADGPAPNDPPQELERARGHYERVAEELRAAETTHLDPATRARREALISELERYSLAAEFTIWHGPGGSRGPVFVDEAGRHCAVANLLRYTGDTPLVDQVAATDNNAWVWDLRGSGELASWLTHHGISFDEAARIQLPGWGIPDVPVEVGEWNGPGDTTGPSGGDERGPNSPPVGPTAPGPQSPAGTPGTPTTAPSPSAPGTPGSESFEDWRVWWEFNKLAWLRSRPLAGPRTGEGSEEETGLARMRRVGRERLPAELDSSNASVRAAAAIAYARAAGPESCAALEELLDDPVREVRLAALVALAATGTEHGVRTLLSVVHADEEPAPGLRAAAIVALAAASVEGQARGVGPILPTLVGELDDDEVYAILTFAAMADDDGLNAFAREHSGLFDGEGDGDAPRAILSRAIEALGTQAPEDVLSNVLDATGDRDLGARRGAAIALGELEGSLEPLMTAYESEREPLVRGYALLSIGRHGGDVARDFLARELKRGPSATRPWSALALGVLAGADDDGEARAALRNAYAKERVRGHRGAFLLAFGLARDLAAEEALIEALASGHTEMRAYAAQGLGLIRTENGRIALNRSLIAEETPMARAAMAQALAQHGDPRDLDTLIAELDRAKSPVQRGQVAAALGMYGSEAAMEDLFERLEDVRLTGESRAAAVSAIAIGLSGRDRLTLSNASAWSNHAVFPGWFLELLQQPM